MHMRGKKKLHGADYILIGCILCLCVLLAWFGGLLFTRMQSARKLCQEVVPLGRLVYDEAFLEEAGKLPGLRSITPVCEVTVRLAAGDYTMETMLLGTDLQILSMTVAASEDTAVGSAPVLLLGRNSLSGMADHNSHTISEKKQRELLENFRETEWSYQIAASGGNVQGGSDTWLPCTVAAVLKEPSDAVCISYEQAMELSGRTPGTGEPVTSVRLTVQGEDNFQNAKARLCQQWHRRALFSISPSLSR